MTTTQERETVAPAVSPEEIAARRLQADPADRVIFRVAGLYGVSTHSAPFPISKTESIDSGVVSITLDPESGASGNVGIMDFEKRYLRVRYNVHAVFPALHELVMSGKHDLSLLGPVRATATDECAVTEDYSGWRALGCMDFLPGSIWAGASGG
ncbi:hypothetical protein ACTMTJ_41150 [Phytohabitans sp. LJ34]|uniref:hypothetical protein n=1 Tax=Phytohabitans sp. LJ34 TaxID=3452217 RepID=UPI003F8CC307